MTENIAYRRKKLRKAQKPIGTYDDDVNDFMRSVFSEDDNTNANELTHLKNSLRVCVEEELTPRQREVLIMRYFQGLDGQKIADALGVNKSTVCRTLHRAEDKLRKFLKYSTPRLLNSKKE